MSRDIVDSGRSSMMGHVEGPRDRPVRRPPGPHESASRPLAAHYRIRYDTVDRHGKLTLRHGGTLHHLGIGRANGRTPALILVDHTHATVTNRHTGEILGTYSIDPDRNYWPKQTEEPDQRPDSS
ncbi:MAG: hypothetical protein Q8M65_11820 [Rhodoglobus sp.]|nr:hypothetical protein [Rhodoglobus sp.]